MRLSATLTIGLLLSCLAPLAPAQTAPAPAPGGTPPPASDIGKGLPPRVASTDYQGQARAGAFSIGAEFMGHSVPSGERAYMTEEYLVVETGLYGAAGAHLTLTVSDFSLRVTTGGKNGKPLKTVTLDGVPFGAVLRSLKDPEWEQQAASETKKEKEDQTQKAKPGDIPPNPKRMPFEMIRPMQLQVRKAVLPEGDRELPQAGLIFFESRIREENIRSVELLYKGPAGEATLVLQ
jgi:hypothetical protein